MTSFCNNPKCRLHKVECEHNPVYIRLYDKQENRMIEYKRCLVSYYRLNELIEYHLCDVCANACKLFEPSLNI